MGRLAGIQHLRALAAVGVVIFHATGRIGEAWNVGAHGVDLFFVISGFLMITISSRRPAPLRFLRDRLSRIVPAYWLATTVMVIGGTAHFFPRMTLTPPHVLGSYLFVPVRAPSGDIVPLLVQGWTLDLEVAFYVLFAGLLLLKSPARVMAAMTIIMLGACALIGVAPAGSDVYTFYANPMILEFALGGWLGVACMSRDNRLKAAGGVLLLAVGLLGLWLAGSQQVVRVAGIGTAAAAMLGGVIAIERRGMLPRLRLLRHLGDASYSIYLWHTLALSIVIGVARHLGSGYEITLIASIVGAVAAGVCAHHLIDRPMIDLIERLRRQPGSREFTPIFRDSGQPAG